EAILAEPETGPRAIAAETEVIELLLQAQRTAGGGGGGGSNSPGTGGEGSTTKSALALVGLGSDDEATIRERQVGQTTGRSSRTLPAEFQDGLDAYFNALEEDSP
ncbi:MAG: hypothetical protein AAGA96_01955, partial [Verrucomicrobiota bacterium]